MKTEKTHPNTPSLTQTDLEILKKQFPKTQLNVKVQTLNKERTRALLVLYLQHTDVQDRLEEVDPAWTSEVLSEEIRADAVFVRTRLTLKGVSRENVGEGSDPKAAYSDALKRCAMLFGVGRYLYESSPVWADYNEAKDRYRQWTIEDYEKAGAAFAPGLKTHEKKAKSRSREELNRILMQLYRPYLVKFPETRFAEFLQERYGAPETRLLTLEQVEDLVQFMETRLKSAA